MAQLLSPGDEGFETGIYQSKFVINFAGNLDKLIREDIMTS